MATGRIISGSRPASLLMRRVCLIVIEFLAGLDLFSKIGDRFRRVQVLLLPPRPDYILKIFFYYFIFML